jgi:hypothetical protein
MKTVQELQKTSAEILNAISTIQKTWTSPNICIADVDSPCDCPKCIAYMATMEAEYKAGKLDPKEDEEECEHWEHDHYICMDCGKDCINDFIGDAESAFEGDR